jgi:predicted PurR-regulated permease PerM
MSTQWSTTTRYIAGVGLALLGIFILYISRAVIPLLIVATLVAVIVRPLILWLQQAAHLSRGLSVALTYLLVAILVPVILMLAFPAMVDAVSWCP